MEDNSRQLNYLCHLCLSTNRILTPLTSALVDMHTLVTGRAPSDPVPLCFECRRRLHVLGEFCAQARLANTLLDRCRDTQVPILHVESLSKLTHTKSTYVYECAEYEDNAVKTEYSEDKREEASSFETVKIEPIDYKDVDNLEHFNPVNVLNIEYKIDNDNKDFDPNVDSNDLACTDEIKISVEFENCSYALEAGGENFNDNFIIEERYVHGMKDIKTNERGIVERKDGSARVDEEMANTEMKHCAGAGKRKRRIKNPPECSTCGKQFRDKQKLYRHQRIHTGEFFPCQHCTNKFRDMYVLSHHMRKKHNDQSRPIVSLQKEEPVPYQPKEIKLRRLDYNEANSTDAGRNVKGGLAACHVCNKTVNKYGLKAHMITHSEERSHLCEVCGKGFRSVPLLKHHLVIHGDKKHVCEVCSAKFRSRSHLWEHKLTHSKERPHKCHLCKASFAWKSRYLIHLKMHAGLNLSTCAVCGKSFPRKAMLRAHMQKKHDS